ncbi:MAG TPA: hypothetical protein PLN05_04575 [Pyrinomonadaceae bacterium]|nr:hypothetical protein [Chloracidobacterium sp.]HRJ89755.1 hypothetical protein [Pyrinomonadaceae bacterium]HRK49684.1 hypothetical protein [Pyrinomonadaceae bacterium]
MKCLACGSESLVGGTIFDSNGAKVLFKLDDTPMWKSLFGAGTRGIRAYGCVHCGHLQLAVDFTEKDLLQYQQFEGEQPGVLERINSEPETLKE